ncbi:LysM peptidoglycan-binding domain-containing protein [Photobacterium sp. CCB-ST2H9]|uniref:LysM peptidoglycan-binding domain-containing protein n=1 Tax=Photobacterium sp. CCB-ST2H9 TaxID=2912855 RepID=UPI0020035070|nr:LysM peptidoglycan-binding domain-containing protein [Photobacterium sp. CCB-ST2H9]UTM59271.1 LysM peptidoglycan-binding domain-containing protein [Photobacterium sp. CCB-ST2H9]
MSSDKKDPNQGNENQPPVRYVKAHYTPLTDLESYVSPSKSPAETKSEPIPEHKIVIELAGQWAPNSSTLSLSKTDEQSEKIAKPQKDNQTKHRSLAVFEGLNTEPRNLYISLPMQDVPASIRLLLAENLQPVEKAVSMAEWDNVLVPVRALVYLSEKQDKANAADLKSGYLYIFWKGKVWRELEITPDGQYRDIDIVYYRNRAKYSTEHEHREADGYPLPQFWVPYKIQGEHQKDTSGVKVLFSPRQMTVQQLDELEERSDSLAQISTTLDELSVYSETKAFEMQAHTAPIHSVQLPTGESSDEKPWLDLGMCLLEDLKATQTAVVYLKEPLNDSPKFEYAVELTCSEDTFKALKLDEVITVAPTAAETETEALKRVENKDSVVYVSKLRVNEAKSLQVKSGAGVLKTSINSVMPDPVNTHQAHDAFIPVQLAVEIGHRLALPTSGYYYHFMADALLHEYKITPDDDNWQYQATKSVAGQLSDELLDDHELSTLILPWRVQDQPAKRQHLLYSPHKLTQQEFDQMDGTWLDKHATLLDLEAMRKAAEQNLVDVVQHQGQGQLYTIRKGDTLTAIAKAHEIKLSELLELNPDYQVGDRKDHIFPGETLILPLEAPDAAEESAVMKIDYFPVKKDATLDEVAASAGISQAMLLEYNPYLQKVSETDHVMAGDVVIVNKTQEQNPEPRIHEVKAINDALGHESLSSIAALYNLSPKQLAEINGLDISDPLFSLRTGQTLKIDPPQNRAEGVQRNTFPAVLVEDYNLAENMLYHYAQPKLGGNFAPMTQDNLLAPQATVVRVASLTTAADIQTIKLCLGRYALDEVEAPYNQSLVLAQKQGKHPIQAALSEKYKVHAHPLASETAHSLTIRQLREGYVYVYYVAANTNLAARYPHADELHEFRYAEGLFERNDEKTPYLPCHSLNGWAYIVFSEREWTEKQRSQFTGDPEFRQALTKNAGAVYDFNQRLVSTKGEEEVFNDLPQLVADIDAGPAIQDHRFADTTTPTNQADTDVKPGSNDKDAKAEKEHFTPVQSNQPYLDTIDPEKPLHADILIIEDGIALAEDSLKLTILANDLRSQWQEKNLQELNLAKAVGDFCNPKILPDNPLVKELEGKELLHAKITKAMIDKLDFLRESRGPNAILDEREIDLKKMGYKPNLSYFTQLNNYANELGLETKEPFNIRKNKFIEQIDQTRKWRSRIRLKEVNEVIVRLTESKVAYDNWVQYVAKCSFVMLNTLGISPELLSFDLESEEHSDEFVSFVTNFQYGFEHTLQGNELIRHKNQFNPDQPLINLVGSIFYQGSQELKNKLEKYIRLYIEHGPNDAFNHLAEMGFNSDQLSQLIEESHQWHLQGSRADQSALTVGVLSFWGAFKEESFMKWEWYKNNILSRYKNIKNSFAKGAVNLLSHQRLHSVNRLISHSLNEQLRLSLDVVQKSPEMKWGTRWISNIISNQIANGEIYLTKGMQSKFDAFRKEELNSTLWLMWMEDGRVRATAEEIEAQRNKILKIRLNIFYLFDINDKKFKKIFKALIVNQANKYYDAVESSGSRGLNLLITGLNFLALIEDVVNISQKHKKDEKDYLTIQYRVAYFADSVLSMNKSTYLSEARGVLDAINGSHLEEDALDNLRSRNLFKASKEIHLLDKETRYILRRAIVVGLAANLALSIAGILETWQIVFYDMPKAKGAIKYVHGLKAASTAAQAFTGALQLASMFGATIPAWIIAGPAIVAGIVYAVCTAYLNFTREDDVTDWLIKTPWVNTKFVGDDSVIWDYSKDGYQKALDALTRLKNKPIIYIQPTAGEDYSQQVKPYNMKVPDGLYSASGYWIMIDFPIELRNKCVKVDALWYGKNNSAVEFIQVDNKEKYIPDWVVNKRPFKILNTGVSPRIPARPYDEIDYISTWQETGMMNQLYRFWLPRPKNSQLNSLLLMVWYPDDLEGQKKNGSHIGPHCFDKQIMPTSVNTTSDFHLYGLKTAVEKLESAFGETLTDLKESQPYSAAVKLGEKQKNSLILVGKK